jgi:transposase
MRQSHRAGEKLFVDDAGHTVAIVERNTGEVREAQIFVAVLGASNDTFAEATWTQSLVDWCGSHVRALRFLGGVPELVVPDYVPGNIIGLMCRSALCGRSSIGLGFYP